ncbi:MAG: aspartate aminotransferase family protein [Clostridiales Family XIII bacterium]|jgi:acetylornithine/N-succinyldiaminopimelate aminotransferase|nr:aspartate aminotransferase family protein [Clostridiales Family XIII bacterium]
MNFEQIRDLEDTYVANTYGRYPLALVKGEGSYAYDPDGNQYIDFTSGIGVNSLGYSDPGWVEAITKQAATIQHTSNLFYTEPVSLVAEEVVKRTGLRRMFFSNSGAEANEGAIKAARKYSATKYTGKDRFEIITLMGSFHGRTMATITATGQDSFHKDFQPFLQGFKYVESNNSDAIKEAVSDKTCAIMLEAIQGEGGVNNLDAEFIETIREICEAQDILLIVDEVQTGIGRTGKFMSYMHYDLNPDIVTVAKGLGGGLPIGGIIFGEKTYDALKAGDHGSTFGGNPVVCAGANYVLSVLNEEFIANVAKKGAYMKEKILAMDGVESVSGKGLMIGIKPTEVSPADAVKNAMATGLLLLTAKDKIRLLPPLSITFEEIDEGLAILEQAIKA